MCELELECYEACRKISNHLQMSEEFEVLLKRRKDKKIRYDSFSSAGYYETGFISGFTHVGRDSRIRNDVVTAESFGEAEVKVNVEKVECMRSNTPNQALRNDSIYSPTPMTTDQEGFVELKSQNCSEKARTSEDETRQTTRRTF